MRKTKFLYKDSFENMYVGNIFQCYHLNKKAVLGYYLKFMLKRKLKPVQL